eukprot:Skav216943  [mRNA]  locus=scaffold3396:103400:109863:+ [translate_table: standard]
MDSSVLSEATHCARELPRLMSLADLCNMRHCLATFVQDCKVKVSLFLHEGTQKSDGSFAMPSFGTLQEGDPPTLTVDALKSRKGLGSATPRPAAAMAEAWDDPPLGFAARGWSMRRGHRKGLEARNLRVQLGSAGGLGRSAVKRSVNRSSRRLEKETMEERKTRSAWHLAVLDGCSEHREQKHQEFLSSLSSVAEVHLETFISFEHALNHKGKKDSWKGEDRSEVASTCSGSDSESDISMHLHLQSCRSPWEAAVLRASLVASCYKAGSAEIQERDPSKKESEKETKLFLTKEQRYLAELSKEYSVKFTYHLEEDPACRFEKFRSEFFYKNANQFLKQLKPLYSPQPQSSFFRLRPAPISRTVQKKFLQIAKDKSHHKSMMAFHGTDHSALGNIYSDGLVVPGLDNKVKVRNGSAFGRGIYAGNADCASISWSYARGLARPMLVCAAWDGPAEEVSHHGSFHVFKTNDNVVPLFEASFVAGQNSLPATAVPKPGPVKRVRGVVVVAQKPKGPGPRTRLPKQSCAPAVALQPGTVRYFSEGQEVRREVLSTVTGSSWQASTGQRTTLGLAPGGRVAAGLVESKVGWLGKVGYGWLSFVAVC